MTFEKIDIDCEKEDSQFEDDIEYSLRCKSFCFSPKLAERLSDAGLNKCWCCFNCWSSFVRKHLVNRNKNHAEIEKETVEWLQSFNCWPLPIFTITICIIDLYFYNSFSTSPNGYSFELMKSNLYWDPKYRNEYHR